MFKHTKISKSIQAALVALMLLATLASGNISTARAQSGGPELFKDAGGADAQAAGRSIARSRLVNLQLGSLFAQDGSAMDASALPTLSFNLFSDANFAGQVTKVEKIPGQTTWIGKLVDVPDGYFYMVQVGDAFIAHVASTQGVYEVSTASNNLYKVVQINQSKLIDDAPGQMAAPGPVLTQADLPANADGASQIDVMVVYTAAARVAEGGTAPMMARIALAVAETNQSYANAGIAPRLRLVHAEEVAYTESGNIDTDKNRLVATADGFMDIVHPLRNIYGADMVSLIVNNGGGYCGLAAAIMATAATAFDVTARDCMTGYYSFGHEFGHLQGARHDPYVDSTTTPFAYGHGYVNFAARWRTVMAYNNRCSDFGANCTRLQWWSNPTKLYNSASMGVVGVSENYRVLNATALTVANFRQATISQNFANYFTSSLSGVASVFGSWYLTDGQYLFTLGVPNYFASVKNTGKYGDVTVQARMFRSGPGDQYNGIVVRGNSLILDPIYKSWTSSYTFSYTNDGRVGVWKWASNGTPTAIYVSQVLPAVVVGGYNVLKVVFNGQGYNFFVNNVLVWAGSDPSFRVGSVGLDMYRDTALGNVLYVDYLSIINTPTAAILAMPADTLPGVPTDASGRLAGSQQ